MVKNETVRKIISISQQRQWQNWSTVEELALKWNLSKRRVQQILKDLNISVEKGSLITIEGTIDPFVSVRPIFKLLLVK